MTTLIGPSSAKRTLLSGAVALALLAGASGALAEDHTAIINNMDYGAPPGNLKVGDTVVWVNRDTVLHSITAKDHSFDIRLNPGQSARMVLSKAGKIPFYCLFHPTMSGSLTVAAK